MISYFYKFIAAKIVKYIMKNKIQLELYKGLNTIPFYTTEENIKNLYQIYYGWSVDAPWRKLNRNPIEMTGRVVINGLRRNYLESLTPKSYADLLRRKEPANFHPFRR